MKITVDPTELIATAGAVETCAVELAEVCTTLRSSLRCTMPAPVRSTADLLVARADDVLDDVANCLHSEAVDLTRRAVVAAADSLVAACGVNVFSGHPLLGVSRGQPLTVGPTPNSTTFTLVMTESTSPFVLVPQDRTSSIGNMAVTNPGPDVATLPSVERQIQQIHDEIERVQRDNWSTTSNWPLLNDRGTKVISIPGGPFDHAKTPTGTGYKAALSNS